MKLCYAKISCMELDTTLHKIELCYTRVHYALNWDAPKVISFAMHRPSADPSGPHLCCSFSNSPMFWISKSSFFKKWQLQQYFLVINNTFSEKIKILSFGLINMTPKCWKLVEKWPSLLVCQFVCLFVFFYSPVEKLPSPLHPYCSSPLNP